MPLINPFDPDKLWLRDLSAEPDGTVKFSMHETPFDDKIHRKDIGFVILERQARNQPFSVMREQAFDHNFAGYLATLTDMGKDDQFFREGFTGYY